MSLYYENYKNCIVYERRGGLTGRIIAVRNGLVIKECRFKILQDGAKNAAIAKVKKYVDLEYARSRVNGMDFYTAYKKRLIGLSRTNVIAFNAIDAVGFEKGVDRQGRPIRRKYSVTRICGDKAYTQRRNRHGDIINAFISVDQLVVYKET